VLAPLIPRRVLSAVAIAALLAGISLNSVNQIASTVLLVFAATITLAHVVLGWRWRLESGNGTLPSYMSPRYFLIWAGVVTVAVVGTLPSSVLSKPVSLLIQYAGVVVFIVGILYVVATPKDKQGDPGLDPTESSPN